MPNWIKNKVIVKNREVVDEIISSFTTFNEEYKELEFDFNKIIPMPKDLEIEFSTKSDDGLLLYLTKINGNITYLGTKEDKLDTKEYNDVISKINEHLSNKRNLILNEEETEKILKKYQDNLEEIYSLGQKQVNNILQYDALNWYEWRIRNWGCKWNADKLEILDGCSFSFETPWEPPLKVIVEMSKAKPHIKIAFLFADEDIGAHVGYMLLQGGKIDYKGSFADHSSDAYQLAHDLWGDDVIKVNFPDDICN